MWECEFDAFKLENHEVNNYINNHPVIGQIILNPRDVFFGGRIENIVSYYKADENKKIRYTYIFFLYLWVCEKGKFPLDHLQIYIGEYKNLINNENKNDLSKVKGLIEYKILPHRNLFIPLLPIKMHNRLLCTLSQLLRKYATKRLQSQKSRRSYIFRYLSR